MKKLISIPEQFQSPRQTIRRNNPMNTLMSRRRRTCVARPLLPACRFFTFLLALVVGLGFSPRSYASKNKVNKSARTLTINSEPYGARVEFNDQYMGVTPLTLTYDKSFFEGHGQWLWSRYLNEGVNMVVSADGCAPQTMEITSGPYDWQNGLGTVSVQYYVFTSYQFDVRLNCSGSWSAPEQRPGNDGSSSFAPPSSPGKVTLQIQSGQGSLIDDAQKLVVVYCLSHRLVLTQARSTMDLEVQVGDRTMAFSQNGSKNMQVEAVDQTYNITGKISMVFSAGTLRGNQSTITLTYDFMGDGTINLSESDVGQTIPLTLTQVNSRVSTMDLSSGEGETEITLNLRR